MSAQSNNIETKFPGNSNKLAAFVAHAAIHVRETWVPIVMPRLDQVNCIAVGIDESLPDSSIRNAANQGFPGKLSLCA